MTTPDTPRAPEHFTEADTSTQLRDAWRDRDAGILAHAAGVWCQDRSQTVVWRSRDRLRMVVVWRKRGGLYVHAGPRESASEATRRPGDPLTTWGQLEALVAGLVPRASEFSDGEADACARIMGGGP